MVLKNQSPLGALYLSVILLGDVQKSKCKSLFSITILNYLQIAKTK